MLAFAFPWAFLALPMPWLIWRWLPARRERSQALRLPFFRKLREGAGLQARDGAVVLRRSRLQGTVAVTSWVLIVLGLARPEWVGQPIVIEKAARDVVIAIDISGSMDQNDFENDLGENIQRLSAVKDVVSRFIEDREGDRVSLIVFGSRAYVQAPFTEDLQTVGELLRDTKVGMAGPHTAIGDAIGLAIRTFQGSEIEQRLLVLLSDGSDTGSRMTPLNAAAIAAGNNVEIFTIGVGDPKAEGEDKVDLSALQDIAARASGQFFFAGDQGALASIYQRIDELTPREIETISFRPRESLMHWPWAVAFLFVLLTLTWLHWQSARQRSSSQMLKVSQ